MIKADRITRVMLGMWLVLSVCQPALAARILLLGDVEGDGIRLDALRPWARQADVVIVNLEAPLTARAFAPLKKQWHLRSAPSLARELQRLAPGRVIGIVANNHAGDCGPLGVADTRGLLHRVGLQTAGDAAWPPRDPVPLRRTIAGRPLIVLAANLVAPASGLPPWTGRADWEKRLTEQVRRLADGGDVVVCLHWNAAEQTLPPAEDRRLAHALIEARACAVVGFHPHVWGAVELMPGGEPILYSCGNTAVACPCSQEPHGAAVLLTTHGAARVLPIDCGRRLNRLRPRPSSEQTGRQLFDWISTISTDYQTQIDGHGYVRRTSSGQYPAPRARAAPHSTPKSRDGSLASRHLPEVPLPEWNNAGGSAPRLEQRRRFRSQTESSSLQWGAWLRRCTRCERGTLGLAPCSRPCAWRPCDSP